MNMLLSGHQIELYESFKAFVLRNIIPKAASWDSSESIPKDLIDQMTKEGYLGSIVPEKYNGRSWDFVTFGLLNEAFGRGSSSLTDLITVQTMVETTLMKWGTENQRKQWLPLLAGGEIIGAYAMTEPTAGSDLQGMKTVFSKKQDRYVISGIKKWISFGEIADLFIVFGKLDGAPIAGLVSRRTPGVEVTSIKNMMGFKAGHLAQISFNGVEITEENILGKPGFAFSYIAPYGLHYGRISTACSACGLLRACFEESLSYVTQREVSGAKLAEKGMVRQMIAEMGVDLEATTQLCINACRAEDSHAPESIDKTLIAKYFSSRAVVRAASDAVQLRGASGCHEGHPVARYYRDAKIMEIIEGTTQIHQDILGRKFIKKAQGENSWNKYPH